MRGLFCRRRGFSPVGPRFQRQYPLYSRIFSLDHQSNSPPARQRQTSPGHSGRLRPDHRIGRRLGLRSFSHMPSGAPKVAELRIARTDGAVGLAPPVSGLARPIRRAISCWERCFDPRNGPLLASQNLRLDGHCIRRDKTSVKSSGSFNDDARRL